MVSPFTAVPRRTSSPGSSSAAFPKTCSITGRRAVYVTNRSSPARAPSSARLGGIEPSRSIRRAPARMRACKTSGSVSSSTSRPAGWSQWARRNWPTPSRAHVSHASSRDSGTGAGSRSKIVTSCPSRVSTIPADNPHTPPPKTMILAIRSLLSLSRARRTPVNPSTATHQAAAFTHRSSSGQTKCADASLSSTPIEAPEDLSSGACVSV